MICCPQGRETINNNKFMTKTFKLAKSCSCYVYLGENKRRWAICANEVAKFLGHAPEPLVLKPTLIKVNGYGQYAGQELKNSSGNYLIK